MPYTCYKCKGKGVIPPTADAKLCACRAEVSNIDEACAVLVQWVSSRDPTYKARIDGVMQERRLDNRELCARVFDYVLRHSLQNELAPNPAFKDGVAPTLRHGRCKKCRKKFEAQWPGQIYCGTVCTEAARAAGEIPDITGHPKPKQEPTPEMVQVTPTAPVTMKWVEPPATEPLPPVETFTEPERSELAE